MSPFAQTISTVEETELNLREAYINFLKRDSLRFLIFHKDTNDFIGIKSFEGLNLDSQNVILIIGLTQDLVVTDIC